MTSTDAMAHWNELAPAAAETRISFGPEAHQVVTADVASMILTLWRSRAPATFGAYLAEVMTGARPTGTRGKNAQ